MANVEIRHTCKKIKQLRFLGHHAAVATVVAITNDNLLTAVVATFAQQFGIKR